MLKVAGSQCHPEAAGQKYALSTTRQISAARTRNGSLYWLMRLAHRVYLSLLILGLVLASLAMAGLVGWLIAT